MPSWAEEKERLRWLIREGKLTDDMKVKIVIPKLDAEVKVENREKKKKFCFMTDEDGVSRLAALNEAYLRVLGENPSIRTAAWITALETFDVKGWYEKQNAAADESSEESLGNA